jgi:GTP-binding protein
LIPRRLKIVEARFVRSAASARDFPREPVPQLAMVGRSNVGKSSVINALTKSRVARTSAAPGKTRLINLYLVDVGRSGLGALYLADLPGYGYARGRARAAQAFDALVTEYFAHAPARRPGKGGDRGRAGEPSTPRGPFGPSAALMLVDARHPGLAADIEALKWIRDQGRPVAVAASKVDKLSRAERQRAVKEWTQALNVPILPVSAVTGEGLGELWTEISRLLSEPNR